MTNIYISFLDDNKITIDELLNNLPNNIQNNVTKYNDEKTKLLSATSWYLLKKYLLEDFNIDISKKKVYENSFHKPLMDDIYFNISHSSNMCAVIISNNNASVDVEVIDKNKDHTDLIKRFFSEEEYNKYLQSNKKAEDFTLLWTKKEAIAKFEGTGLLLSNLKNSNYDKVVSRIIGSYNEVYYLSYISADYITKIKRIVL